MWFSNFLTKIALFSNIKPIVFGVYFVWRCKIVPSREELCDLLFCVAVCIIVSRAHCEGGGGYGEFVVFLVCAHSALVGVFLFDVL